jgi:DNA-binding transcriptional ArsR family regulator
MRGMGIAHEDITEPAPDALEMHRVLHALSDPIRLEVVRQLDSATDECRCGSFSDVGVSKSTLSHHLKTLREAGLTRTRPSGTTRYVSLRRDDLDERFPGLLDAILVRP